MKPQHRVISSQRSQSDKRKQFVINTANAEAKYKGMIPKPSDVFGIQLSLFEDERKDHGLQV
jgi:hypothetical protein